MNLSDTPFENKTRRADSADSGCPARTRGVGGVRDALRYGPGSGRFRFDGKIGCGRVRRHRCRFRRKGREEHEVCGCHRTGGGEGDAAPQCRGGACKPAQLFTGDSGRGTLPLAWLCTVYQLYGPARRRQLPVGVRRVSRWRNWFIRTCISSSLPILPGAVRRNP